MFIPSPADLAAAKRQQDYEQGVDPNDASLSNLQAWWRADRGITRDGSNLVSVWSDNSSNGYTLSAAGPQQPTWEANGFGAQPSLLFNGSSTHMANATPTNLNYERTDSFSFAGWLYSNGGGAPWAHQKLGVEGYLFYFAPEPRFYLIGTNSSIMQANGANVPSNAWFHYVCTYDGTQHPSGVKMYVNGSSVAVSSASDSLSANIANNSAFYVGEREVEGLLWNGKIYEVASWKSVISAANVLKLYNRGKFPLGV
jgi:hypothetical protein